MADPLEGYWETDLLPLLLTDGALQAITLLQPSSLASILWPSLMIVSAALGAAGAAVAGAERS